MTQQTWKPRVIAIVVLELREVGRRLQRGMSEESLITCLARRLWNRAHVTRRYRPAAERNVALRADKRRALVSLVYLVVKNSTFVERRRNVTTFGATT